MALTKVKEIQQNHYIIDNTYRGASMDKSSVIAGVVVSDTGPCEETEVSSVTELCDLYMNNDTLSLELDTTLLHAAKILQFSPIHLIRAASDTIKAGVTNNGSLIYTDKNFIPYKYSKEYSLLSNSSNNPGYLGFYIPEEDKSYVLNFKGLPTNLNDLVPEGSTLSDWSLATGDVLYGIDPIFSQVESFKGFGLGIGKLKGIGFDFKNNGFHTVYTSEDASLNIYPGSPITKDNGWIHSVSFSDISNDVVKVSVTNPFDSDSIISEGNDYLTINGYSFYLGVENQTTNISVPGTGIEINIPREEGSVVTAPIFSLYVYDEIVNNNNFVNPVVSEVDSKVSFSLDTGKHLTILTNMDDLLSIKVDNEELDGEDSTFEGGKAYSVSGSENISKVEISSKVFDSTTFSSDKYFVISVSDSENYNSNIEIEETYTNEVTIISEGSTNTLSIPLDYSVNVNSSKKMIISIENENEVITSCEGVYDPASTITFKNWSNQYNSLVGNLRVENNKYIVTIIDNNNTLSNSGIITSSGKLSNGYGIKVSYATYEFKDFSCVNGFFYNMTTSRPYNSKNTIVVGSVSVPMAIFKLGCKMDEVFKDQDNDNVPKFIPSETSFYKVGNVTMYSLRSSWRTVASSTKDITVETPKNFKRVLISKDAKNNTQQKDCYVLKIGNIVFWNGKKGSYQPSSINEDVYNLGMSEMTLSEFIEALNDKLPSFASTIPNICDKEKFILLSNSPITTEVKFTNLNNDNENIGIKEGSEHDYEYELSDRFAIISKFPSKSKLMGVKMVKHDDETWDLTIRRKDKSSTFNISFDPGYINGYGVGIYFDYVNSDSIDFKMIELNKSALPQEILTEITFGDEIPVYTPGINQRQNALSKLLLETGYYYDYITDLGYNNVAFDVYADSIAKNLHASYIFSCPKEVLTVEDAIRYRDATQIDSRNSSLFIPYYKDSTLGSFTVELSPSTAVLERLFINKALFKEFAPVFGPVNGELGISVKQSSNSGLLVEFNTREEREALQTAQINPIRVDKGLGITYINDSWTLQKKDSYLSDLNNVVCTNIIQHVLNSFTKQYFAQFNNQATRDNVVKVLTNAFRERLFSNQTYTPISVEVICNKDNNPQSVVNDRKLIIDIKTVYEVGIKYIDTYTRIELPVSES